VRDCDTVVSLVDGFAVNTARRDGHRRKGYVALYRTATQVKPMIAYLLDSVFDRYQTMRMK
jgi:hypothetical protein